MAGRFHIGDEEPPEALKDRYGSGAEPRKRLATQCQSRQALRLQTGNHVLESIASLLLCPRLHKAYYNMLATLCQTQSYYHVYALSFMS